MPAREANGVIVECLGLHDAPDAGFAEAGPGREEFQVGEFGAGVGAGVEIVAALLIFAFAGGGVGAAGVAEWRDVARRYLESELPIPESTRRDLRPEIFDAAFGPQAAIALLGEVIGVADFGVRPGWRASCTSLRTRCTFLRARCTFLRARCTFLGAAVNGADLGADFRRTVVQVLLVAGTVQRAGAEVAKPEAAWRGLYRVLWMGKRVSRIVSGLFHRTLDGLDDLSMDEGPLLRMRVVTDIRRVPGERNHTVPCPCDDLTLAVRSHESTVAANGLIASRKARREGDVRTPVSLPDHDHVGAGDHGVTVDGINSAVAVGIGKAVPIRAAWTGDDAVFVRSDFGHSRCSGPGRDGCNMTCQRCEAEQGGEHLRDNSWSGSLVELL